MKPTRGDIEEKVQKGLGSQRLHPIDLDIVRKLAVLLKGGDKSVKFLMENSGFREGFIRLYLEKFTRIFQLVPVSSGKPSLEDKAGLLSNLEVQDLFEEQPIQGKETPKEEASEDVEESDKFFEGEKFIPKRLADEIAGMHKFRSLSSPNRNDIIFYYNGGVYHQKGEEVIAASVRDILGERCRMHFVNEVQAHIAQTSYLKQEELNPDPNKLNLKNGYWLLKESEFVEGHDPNLFTLTQIPVVYNPGADCPKIKAFLKQILEKENIPKVQEMTGYCLYPGHEIQVMFMFIGPENAGKSTVISAIKSFLGVDNVVSKSLFDLTHNRFSLEKLYGKLANLHADLTDKAIRETGILKMLRGGDLISAEQKFRGDLNFVNHTKQIFSCNKLPETEDTSGAYYKSWEFLVFPNQFNGKAQNKGLLAELTTEEELSGLFNWAIKGLQRLLKNGEFSNTMTTEQKAEFYQRMSSSIAGFLLDCTEQGIDETPKAWIYAAYCVYCKEKKLVPESEQHFFKNFRQYLDYQVVDTRPKIEGLRAHCIKGLKLTQDDKTDMQGDKQKGLGEY